MKADPGDHFNKRSMCPLLPPPPLRHSSQPPRLAWQPCAAAPATPAPASVVVTSPREQRTPRPKVQIPSPAAAAAAQDSPDGTKPLSPFAPPDGYQPVTDWGDAMEEQSPCSSLGESPLKPPSAESSPAQSQSQGRRPQEGGRRGGRRPPTDLREKLNAAAGRRGS
jgi:hypothetical protein